MVALCLGLLLLFPDWLTRDSIADFLNGLGGMALLVYLVLSLTRSLLLIPCTPFVLAGGISFPELQWLVWLISLFGVVAGALLVYSFPSFGNYDEYLERKYPDKVASLKDKMHGKYAFWIVAGWSFFPIVPTDLICYVAGMAKMPYQKMVPALLLGEIPLVTLYVYVGVEFGEWLRL